MSLHTNNPAPEILDFIREAIQPNFFDLDGESQHHMMQVMACFVPDVGFRVDNREQAEDLAYGLDCCARWCRDCAHDCEREDVDPSYDLMLEQSFEDQARQVRALASGL